MKQENYNLIFSALSDPTRRDILQKVALRGWTVNELAGLYVQKTNTISKHLKVLENAKLIIKQRKGKYRVIKLAPKPFQSAYEYLEFYKQFWDNKLDSLQHYLETDD